MAADGAEFAPSNVSSLQRALRATGAAIMIPNAPFTAMRHEGRRKPITVLSLRVTLGDVQGLNNRIQQLEDALAKANSQQPIQPDTPNQGQPTPAISVSEETPNSASVQSTIPATIQNSIAFSEQSLSPLVFSQTPASVDDTHITPSADGSRPGSYIGPNWFFRGIHAFSEDGRRWISSKTGQTIDWSKLQIFTAKPSPFAKLHAQLSPDRCHLPDQASLRELLSSYLNSSFRLRFPLIDKVLFEDTINEAYGDPDNILPPPVRLAARACVFGAVSLMTFLPDAQPGSLGLDGNESAARASYLLSQLIGYWLAVVHAMIGTLNLKSSMCNVFYAVIGKKPIRYYQQLAVQSVHSVGIFVSPRMPSQERSRCQREENNMLGTSSGLLMFYATNAAIALFLNMIIHPEDTDGQLDLELLISAANAIRTAIPRTPTREESTRIQRTSDFIMRLMWLGSCAITKSQEEGLQHEL
ncbi:fungal specific transcription factor [Colletotrichum acutatum]